LLTPLLLGSSALFLFGSFTIAPAIHAGSIGSRSRSSFSRHVPIQILLAQMDQNWEQIDEMCKLAATLQGHDVSKIAFRLHQFQNDSIAKAEAKCDAKWIDKVEETEAKWIDKVEKTESKWIDKVEKTVARWSTKVRKHESIASSIKPESDSPQP
jgi:uncharacterized protein (DUF885 family)